jgi:hypothetical protein
LERRAQVRARALTAAAARALASFPFHGLPTPRIPRLPPSSLHSAYYFIHKQTQETVWELDAAEMARVRAEAKAAGLTPLP